MNISVTPKYTYTEKSCFISFNYNIKLAGLAKRLNSAFGFIEDLYRTLLEIIIAFGKHSHLFLLLWYPRNVWVWSRKRRIPQNQEMAELRLVFNIFRFITIVINNRSVQSGDL